MNTGDGDLFKLTPLRETAISGKLRATLVLVSAILTIALGYSWLRWSQDSDPQHAESLARPSASDQSADRAEIKSDPIESYIYTPRDYRLQETAWKNENESRGPMPSIPVSLLYFGTIGDHGANVFMGEHSGDLMIRVLAPRASGSNTGNIKFLADLDSNGLADEAIDLFYSVRGLEEPHYSSDTEYISGWADPSGCSWGRIKSKGKFQYNILDATHAEYIWLMPKSEISLSGQAASLEFSQRGVGIRKFVVKFKQPFSSQTLEQFQANYPMSRPWRWNRAKRCSGSTEKFLY